MTLHNNEYCNWEGAFFSNLQQSINTFFFNFLHWQDIKGRLIFMISQDERKHFQWAVEVDDMVYPTRLEAQ